MAPSPSPKLRDDRPSAGRPSTRRSSAPLTSPRDDWAIRWLRERPTLVGAPLVHVAEAFLDWLTPDESVPPEDGAARREFDRWRVSQGTTHPACYAWEALLAVAERTTRKRAGAWFTPGPIARWLIDAAAQQAESRWPGETPIILDPACGSGVFLLEAAARLPHARRIGYERIEGTARVATNLCGGAAQVAVFDPLTAAAPPDLGSGPLLIVGNPPYSAAKRPLRADDPLRAWTAGLSERKAAVADDYARFLRWAQQTLEARGRGVVAMIVARTPLDGLTHRAMRRSLRETFESVQVVDLGGDLRRGRAAVDENVFPIRTGVALLLLVKDTTENGRRLQVTSLVGGRAEKLATLDSRANAALDWRDGAADLEAPWTIPANRAAPASAARWRDWPRLVDVFHEHTSGVQTKRDALWTASDPQTLLAQLCADGIEADPALIQPIAMAPWVHRFVYYDPRRIGRARWPVMRRMLRPNFGLVFMRQSMNEGPYDHVLAVRELISDRCLYSRRGTPFLAPRWLHDESAANPIDASPSNLRPEFLELFGDDTREADAFAWTLAVLSSRVYRDSYVDELRRDFPRVPPPPSTDVREAVADLGTALLEAQTADDDAMVDEELFSPIELERAGTWTVGGFPVVNRWAGARKLPKFAGDPRGYEPILRRWRRIERLLDQIDPLVESVLR